MVDYMNGRRRRRCCCPGDNQGQPVAERSGSIFPGGSSESNAGIESHTLGELVFRLMIGEGARRRNGLGGVRAGGPRQRGNGFVERRDVLAHHLCPEHRGGSIATEDKIASCETVQASPGVP